VVDHFDVVVVAGGPVSVLSPGIGAEVCLPPDFGELSRAARAGGRVAITSLESPKTGTTLFAKHSLGNGNILTGFSSVAPWRGF
jgi:hypothetical protein